MLDANLQKKGSGLQKCVCRVGGRGRVRLPPPRSGLPLSVSSLSVCLQGKQKRVTERMFVEKAWYRLEPDLLKTSLGGDRRLGVGCRFYVHYQEHAKSLPDFTREIDLDYKRC